jgi:starch phosphorylase
VAVPEYDRPDRKSLVNHGLGRIPAAPGSRPYVLNYDPASHGTRLEPWQGRRRSGATVGAVKAIRSFTVRARLPKPLAALQDLAFNLRWSWDERTRDAFRWVDPDNWERFAQDPVRLLASVSSERLNQLAADATFLGFLGEVDGDLRRYLAAPRWFQNRPPGALRAVAYFSPEFGIAEAVPQYSGGLGVLAGDHLKAASGLGVPLTGVGLFYRNGYFRQFLNAEGWQEEDYPVLDPHSMALTLVENTKIHVDLADRQLAAQIWMAQVGRIKLYLLDADVEENQDDELWAVTDRLYGGDVEHRLRQEILLGIGGVRALAATGTDTQVFHTNEGHAGFLGLERIRQLVTAEGLSFSEALEAVRSGTIFTTHTPVPAGIDRFPRDLMQRYFKSWAEECGVSMDRLMALGHFPDESPDAPFNMAVMGLRLAGMSNGVSKLHGVTSRNMFEALWPSVPAEEAPIGSVTNGVHGRTWASTEIKDLFIKHVTPAWDEAGDEEWARILDARDEEVWRVREQSRAALVDFVRARLKASLLGRGVSETDVNWTEEVLDPRLLTIGFSRRFAPYKRATLLLSQPERLRALLLSEDRPIQMVFAGKAHPADEPGKAMIRHLVEFSSDPAVRHRITFVENYDMAVARMLVQGCDVWLNTPRRPLEASGTSGEKAALNGALNCSILDGWWDEMFDGSNGWAISSAESYLDLDHRDRVEANSLFELLENQIVPLFYDRSEGRLPHRWIRRVKHSLRVLGPRVQASRQVQDYVEQMYDPIAVRAEALTSNKYRRAKALSGWKQRVIQAWPEVAVEQLDADTGTPVADLGEVRSVRAVVALGSLSGDDVAVELLRGSVGPNDELLDTTTHSLALVGPDDSAGEGRYVYEGSFPCEKAGRYGFTLRVVPANSDLGVAIEMGCVVWA